MGELFDLMDHNLMEKLYVSPKGNVCMYSRCRRYCDTYHAVCGNPDTIESSLSVNLRLNDTDHTKVRSPTRCLCILELRGRSDIE